MPIRSFICEKCDTVKKVLNPKSELIQCLCGGLMSFDLPDLADWPDLAGSMHQARHDLPFYP